MDRQVNITKVINSISEKYDLNFIECSGKAYTMYRMFSNPVTTTSDGYAFTYLVHNSDTCEVLDSKQDSALDWNQIWFDEYYAEYAKTPCGLVAPVGCYCSDPTCDKKFNCPTLSCGVKRRSYVSTEGEIIWVKCSKCEF